MSKKTFWLLIAVVAAVYLFGLAIPLVGPDEPRYAQVAREMFERGDWITPTLGGSEWFEKPALLYWLQAAAYSIFGVSEFAARLGPALFGIGTVACLFAFGRIAGKGSDDFGFWIGISAASSLGLITFARGASFDITVTFPLAAAMVSYFAYDRLTETRGRVFYLALFYIFIGLAVLAKGLIGAVFPLVSVTIYLLVRRRQPTTELLLSLIWGGLLAIAVASIWYLPMYLRHGYEFLDEFFVQHHFQRFSSNKYRHPQPFYFFLWVLPLMTLPWLPFAVAGLWKAIKNWRSALITISADGDKQSLPAAIVYAFVWLLVPLFFFSLSGSKLPGYILPSLPPAMILTGIYLTQLTTTGRVWRNAILSIAAVTLVTVVAALVTVVPSYAEADSVRGMFREAAPRDAGAAPVAVLHHPSHNAEFYAAGRILRGGDGSQMILYGPGEVAAIMGEKNLEKLLVLVPKEYASQLTGYSALNSSFIAENSETTLLLAEPRR